MITFSFSELFSDSSSYFFFKVLFGIFPSRISLPFFSQKIESNFHLYLYPYLASLTEDFCGVEPVTLPPIDKETRPPPIIDEDRLRSYDGVSAGFLGSKDRLSNHYRPHPELNYRQFVLMFSVFPAGVLLIILLLLILMAILIYRHQSRHKGEYLTQEDKGADDAMDPDEAVVQGTTGHHVTKKREWFI